MDRAALAARFCDIFLIRDVMAGVSRDTNYEWDDAAAFFLCWRVHDALVAYLAESYLEGFGSGLGWVGIQNWKNEISVLPKLVRWLDFLDSVWGMFIHQKTIL